MSRKNKIIVVCALAVLVGLLMIFLGGYKLGLSQCKPLQPVVKEEVKKPAAKKKPPKKVAQARIQVPKPAKESVPTLVPAPIPVLLVIPAATPEQRLTLRLNVVEWSQVFEGKSLMSRDIGPLIRKGLSDGTVVRTAAPLTFNVNGAAVAVQNGQAVLDTGPIGPETVIVARSLEGAKFVSPPNGLPLTTNPGELDALVKKGAKEIWLNFILDP